jgi:acetyl-CoA carboxylase carboxyl transferase subunit alpha
VITAESCAAILWSDASKRAHAADALKATSYDVQRLGCVDDVVPEPDGGAHLEPGEAFAQLDQCLTQHLQDLLAKPAELLVTERQKKFRDIAQFFTT